jgi:CO/xanthine dehydrogenase FAD-binding subunit
LAGGSHLIASGDASVEAVVDLQGLDLGMIRRDEADGAIHVGAMATRTTLAEDASLRRFCDGIVAEGAHRWAGNVQRNQATVGGALVVAADNDPLVAALVACDASVVLYGHAGFRQVTLVDFIAQRRGLLGEPSLVTKVVIPDAARGCRCTLAMVARTPADAPIVVAAVAVAVHDGRCAHVRAVLGGVAETPLCLPEIETMLVGRALGAEILDRVASLTSASVSPRGDFRGSAEYRRAMAGVMIRRALARAGTQAQ